MPDPAAARTISNLNLPQIIVAVGALGTAAYGFVDASKSVWGGVSRVGFGDIRNVISKLIAASKTGSRDVSALGLASVLDTLRANWMNGMAMSDQKSVAKALIKLNLNESNASSMAAATGVDAPALASVSRKIANVDAKDPQSSALTPQESDVFGRFDLLLSSLLDQAYQRGDQRYRNTAKLAACCVAVVLSLTGNWVAYGTQGSFLLALFAGLAATPLAPIAKDLASSIQAGVKVAQAWKS